MDCGREATLTLTQISRRLASGSERVLDESADLDEVVGACTDSLRPHALLMHDPRATLSTSLSLRRIGSTSITRLRYGTGVTVAPAGPEEETFLLTVPLAGRGRLRYGREDARVRRGALYLVGPYEPFRFDFSDDYDQLVVRFDRRRVETVAARLTGERPDGGLRVPLELGEATEPVLGLLDAAVAVADAPGATAELVGERLEEILIETLLAPRLTADRHQVEATSELVRRAQERLLASLDEPTSLTAVAASCGVGLRTLQLAFRRELGTTPGAWIRDARLDRAYLALVEGTDQTETVTAVALRHGFLHLGEFASRFRARFGVTPSAVLRRR